MLYHFLVDEAQGEGASRQEARDEVEEFLSLDENGMPDRETWGLLPQHQRGLAAAVSMFGEVQKPSAEAMAQLK